MSHDKPVSEDFTNRHGERCSQACGEGRHADCTETMDTCNCTYRGLHKTMHRYLTISPVSDKRTEEEREQRAQEFIQTYNLWWIGYNNLAAFAAEEVSRAVAEEREACAKAMCRFCSFGYKPTLSSAYWHHVMPEGIGSCYAADIHERTRKGE